MEPPPTSLLNPSAFGVEQTAQQYQLSVVFNPVYTTGVEALAEKWDVLPAAVVRRAVRELLKENDLYHPHRPLSHPSKPAEPAKVHRTIRISPTQAGVINGIADRFQWSRSETVRALLSHASRQPITHQHLERAPAEIRSVRFSVRLTPQQDEAVRRVADVLRCSLTDAAAALLASPEAQRSLLHQLTQHPPNTTQPTTHPPAGKRHQNRPRQTIPPSGVMGTDRHQPEATPHGQQNRLPL